MLDNNSIRQKANMARRKCLEMCVNAGKGHVTSAFSCADIVTVLYYGGIMRYDPKNPQWEDRDRFIMSKNHAIVITFPILADLGFFDEHEMDTFMMNHSRFGSHAHKSIPGIDFSGGALGIGLGIAAGLAYSAKNLIHKNYYSFALLGDGECYEGSIWESVMFAGHNELHNLVAVIDRNKLGASDFTEKMLCLEPFKRKWQSFGWDSVEIDGHDITALRDVLTASRSRQSRRPLCIIANTIKGKGIPYMYNQPFLHGAAPSGEKAKRAFEELESDNTAEDKK